MDLRAVRYVVTLAEELHFGRAARRHHISPQPFGQRVRQLERELGYPLFARTSRRVRPTPQGDTFVRRARELLAEFDSLTGYDDGRGRGDRGDAAGIGLPRPEVVRGIGVLEVGVLGFGLADRWRPVLDALDTHAPGLRLVHRDLDLVSQYQLVQDGEIDAGFVCRPGHCPDGGPDQVDPRSTGRDRTGGLIFDLVFRSPPVAVVPVRSELAGRLVLRTGDLQGHPLLPVASASARAGSPTALRRPEAIAGAVATTGAIALHVAAAERYYPHPDVRYVPLAGPTDLDTGIALVTREDDRRPAVRALRRAVASVAERPDRGAPGGVDRNRFD